MDIVSAIELSADSILKEYYYKENNLNLFLELGETNEVIQIQIECNHVVFNVSRNEEHAYRTCFIELKNLSETLKTENGIYIPSDRFGEMMQEKKQNLNLAYGLKDKEYSHVFHLSGHDKLVSCVISNLDKVRILDI